MTRMTDAVVEAYRRSVLDALGADDPNDVQAAEPARWRDLIEQAGADLRTQPAAGEWSVLECLGHMTDSELVTGARYRWILAEDQPPLQGWDQEAWATRFAHGEDDPAVLLATFGALRRANRGLWLRTPVADHDRFGVHAERGPESYGLLFRLQAGHGRVHLRQAEAALAAVRRSR